MIEAVTFDFWDTIAADDSDEPKRHALGLPSKAQARTELFARAVTRRHPTITVQRATAAYEHSNQLFRHNWHREQRTPGVSFRIYEAYKYLGLSPASGNYGRFCGEVDELVREIEAMEVRIAPDFAPHIDETLAVLAQRHKLGIISDTIHTTGQGLRYLLQTHGLLSYFSYFIFSDEVKAAKPASSVFRQAALGLGVAPNQMVHVGDRESNDIAGPKAVNMHAILYTGVVDRGSADTQADAVCRNHLELPQIIQRIP